MSNSIVSNEAEGIFTLTSEQRDVLCTDYENLSEDFTQRVQSFYEDQGYVLIRGLIDEKLLLQLQKAGNVYTEKDSAIKSTFSQVKFGLIYAAQQEGEQYHDLRCFREVATKSAVSAFTAKVLLDMNSDGNSDKNKGSCLRVLNDVFLAKTGREDSFCGWHVDDSAFWPCSAHQDESTPVGVNAWIAISDIPSSSIGGGMAIVPKSHKLGSDCYEWIHEAHEVIGTTKTHPKEGFQSLEDLGTKTKFQTCAMASLSPELNQKMESIKKMWDYKAGDVLFMSRWLWHRSVQTPNDKALSRIPYQRYTIRYECGGTRSFENYSFAFPSLHDQSLSGKTLDEISTSTLLPFYPKAWPFENDECMARENEFVSKILPALEQARRRAFQTLMKKN